MRNIGDLFRYGEGGAAYAFPDLSSLFQDAAGTVPVTAVGQRVYRVNDISGRSNHLLQATALFRPRLGRTPAGGVRNLLSHTENFSGATWLKPADVTITANATTAPDGTSNASKLSPIASGTEKFVYTNVFSLVPAQPHVCSFYAKAAEKSVAYIIDIGGSPSRVCYFNLTTGVATLGSYGSNPFMVDAGDGWWLCGYTRPSRAAWLEIGLADAVGSTNVTANGADGIYIFGAQINVGSVRGAYQKVTDLWDVTEQGKRDCYCLYGDGVDDTMATAGNVMPVRNGLSAVGAFGHVFPAQSTTQGGLFGLSDLSTTYFTISSLRRADTRQAAGAVQNAAGAFTTTTALGNAGFQFGAPVIIAGTQDGDVLSVETTNPDSDGTVAAALGSTVSASVPIRIFPAANISPVRWYGGIVIDRPLTSLERAFAMDEFAYLSGASE